MEREAGAYGKVEGAVVGHAWLTETVMGFPKEKARAPLFLLFPIVSQRISQSDSPKMLNSTQGIKEFSHT